MRDIFSNVMKVFLNDAFDLNTRKSFAFVFLLLLLVSERVLLPHRWDDVCPEQQICCHQKAERRHWNVFSYFSAICLLMELLTKHNEREGKRIAACPALSIRCKRMFSTSQLNTKRSFSSFEKDSMSDFQRRDLDWEELQRRNYVFSFHCQMRVNK